jgi:hypothetical protein
MQKTVLKSLFFWFFWKIRDRYGGRGFTRPLTFLLGPLSYAAELSATFGLAATLLASWTEFQFFYFIKLPAA